MKPIVIILILTIVGRCQGLPGDLLGCFKTTPNNQNLPLNHIHHNKDCAISCYQNYYKYYSFYYDDCMCSNFLGSFVSNSTCEWYCLQYPCNTSDNITNTYDTGNTISGPPTNFSITNVTSNSCRLIWQSPIPNTIVIDTYVVGAVIMKTFSSYPQNNPEWSFNNSTYQTELTDLWSATQYNISIHVRGMDGLDGASASRIIITKLADPEFAPEQPQIISHEGKRIKIKIIGVSNNNGPISSYMVVVVRADDNQAFRSNDLTSYDTARKRGLSYYVAAELNPKNIETDFIVGDSKMYGEFYNAPLDSTVNYNILVGVVSKFNGETKTLFSNASGFHNGVSILNVYDADNVDDDDGNSSTVVIVLSVAIALLTFLMILGIVGFFIIKSKILTRRQRLSDNQELTLQGPMIEVENNGYIHDEDVHIPAKVHYRKLLNRVRTIPYNQLKVDPTNLIGIGKFGKVNTGTLHENDRMTTVTCYSIQDRKLNEDSKKSMLHELDVVIKAGTHSNVINMLGTSESTETVVIVIDYNSINLKDFLLGSRDNLPTKFSSMTEHQALEIGLGICRGMAHLHSMNIIHKQLCARNVLMSSSLTPKITGFGLSQYFSRNKVPDYTRWTALEVFKGYSNDRCDIWSYGCVLWEIIAIGRKHNELFDNDLFLGGTPYGNIPNNNDIPDNLKRGLRLPQLKYVDDSLYQILLDCWQLIPDERPDFTILMESLSSIDMAALQFNLYSDFQYEQFYPDLELSVRPIF